DKATCRPLISGMGGLHLEIKVHRLREDFRLKVRVGKPRVSYRETLRQPVRVVGEFVRQAGAAGLFAKVTVDFAPLHGADATRGRAELEGVTVTVAPQLRDSEKIPAEFLAAAEDGIRSALQSGELGYPVIDVKAVIVDAELDQ